MDKTRLFSQTIRRAKIAQIYFSQTRRIGAALVTNVIIISTQMKRQTTVYSVMTIWLLINMVKIVLHPHVYKIILMTILFLKTENVKNAQILLVQVLTIINV